MTEITVGKAVRLTHNVQRITAPNAGPMTGAGTNTYLIGSGPYVVLDPGPADQAHIKAILEATSSNIETIVVTHTHPDHSPAAKALVEATGAQLVGCMMTNDGFQDESFRVETNVSHGDEITIGDLTLEAIHTPGHVGNHYCYLLRDDQMLFTGDHIMADSTVVIIPPSGDMADYLNSLQLLLDYDIQSLAPGHGDVMENSQAIVEGLIQHRMMREAKVINALQQTSGDTLKNLTPIVYDDVDESLHPVAQISLWAHLLKLEKEHRVQKHQEQHWVFGEEEWQLIN